MCAPTEFPGLLCAPLAPLVATCIARTVCRAVVFYNAVNVLFQVLDETLCTSQVIIG